MVLNFQMKHGNIDDLIKINCEDAHAEVYGNQNIVVRKRKTQIHNVMANWYTL